MFINKHPTNLPDSRMLCICVNKYMCVCVCVCGNARGVIVILEGNWYGELSSNPGRDCFHFT